MNDTTQAKPFKKELQVKLTVEDRLELSERLSRGVQELQRLEEAKKEVTADYAAKIKAEEAQCGNLSRTISNGYEYRLVECFWQYEWDAGIKHLIRTDTSEKVKAEPISMEERQQQLDLVEAQADGAVSAIESRPDHDDHCPECEHHVFDENGQVACGLTIHEPCVCTVCAQARAIGNDRS